MRRQMSQLLCIMSNTTTNSIVNKQCVLQMIARLSCEHIELNSEIVYIWRLECNLEIVYAYLLIETLN